MGYQEAIQNFDDYVNQGLLRMEINSGGIFDLINAILNGVNDAILAALNAGPFYVTTIAIAIIAWRCVSLRFGIFSAIGLFVCELMGLWPDTMSTLSLVISATFFALLFALPAGIIVGYNRRLRKTFDPLLDLLQTFPPYIYLLPGIALLGYGPATALASTIIVTIPPAFRLTALGISLTPIEYKELGGATGLTNWQMFYKIRLPFAMPSMMAGVNQSIMVAFGMVVIAGIVGSGGLGETIYKAVLKLNIATSIDASIAIVIITVILDRVSQSASRARQE